MDELDADELDAALVFAAVPEEPQAASTPARPAPPRMPRARRLLTSVPTS